MISVQTKLNVVDNSGAKYAQCIKVLKNKRWADVGDIIIVSIKEIIKQKQFFNRKIKVNKGEVVPALVVRTKSPIIRKDGTIIKFNKNSIILLTPSYQPLGTKIFGPVTQELRAKGFSKSISLAERVL